MFGKLLKYDLRSMCKTCVPLWLALLAVAVINCFTVRFRADTFLGSLPTVVFMIFYVALIIAAVMVSVVLVITRFYNGLLKDEGYLMFTLPVKPWQLVVSKGLTATIITLVSAIVAIVSVFLVASGTETITWFFREVWRIAPQLTGDLWLSIVLGVVLLISTAALGVSHIYAALAVGHLAQKHRMGFAVLAYIGMDAAVTAIGMVFVELSNHIHLDLSGLPTVATINLVLTIALAATLAQIAIYYLITERILTKRLNLE